MATGHRQQPAPVPDLCGWAHYKGSLVLGPDGDPVSHGEGIITPGERAAVLVL